MRFLGLGLGLTVVPAVLQLLLLPMCPESPRYLLITRQREDEARRGEKSERMRHSLLPLSFPDFEMEPRNPEGKALITFSINPCLGISFHRKFSCLNPFSQFFYI